MRFARSWKRMPRARKAGKRHGLGLAEKIPLDIFGKPTHLPHPRFPTKSLPGSVCMKQSLQQLWYRRIFRPCN
jgi:hypothetical protein